MADKRTLLRRIGGDESAMDHPTPGQSSLCPGCGYTLTGLGAGATCPECGVAPAGFSRVSPAHLKRVAEGAMFAGATGLFLAIWAAFAVLKVVGLAEALSTETLLHPVLLGVPVVLGAVGLWIFSSPEPGGATFARPNPGSVAIRHWCGAGGVMLTGAAGAAAMEMGEGIWVSLLGAAAVCVGAAAWMAIGHAANLLARMKDWRLVGAFDDMPLTLAMTAIVGMVVLVGPVLALALWGAAMLRFASRARRAAGDE